MIPIFLFILLYIIPKYSFSLSTFSLLCKFPLGSCSSKSKMIPSFASRQCSSTCRRMKSYDISNSNQEENTSYFILSHGGVAVHFQIDMGALIIRYWGPHVDIKEEDVVSQDEYPSFLFSKSIPYSDFDHRLHPGIMREHSRGWLGHPTIQGHRKNGCDWSTQFHVQTASLRQQDSQEGSSSESTSTDQHFHVHLYDDSTYLSLYMTYILNSFGVLKITYELVNNHPEQEEVYYLQNLIYWLPLPHHVTETLDFYGHWSKERIPQRHKQIPVGCWMRESWEGRPGHSYTIGTLAMTSGTTFAYGDVWSVALAYSGNSRYWIEKTYMGITSIGVEEILFPGEVILQSKQSYLAPPVLAVYSSQGLDGSAHVYHEYLRSLYKRRRPSIPFHRPMTLNLWEAIYFQHDPDRIRKIVDAAVEIGVERIVLDDGWFSSRRNDTSGLGDWMISEDVYPNHTLDHISQYIISKGIQFGLWFEGEMVNVDSNVFRQHPDWIMDEKGRIVTNTTSTKSTSVSWRHQYVLNLAHPDAFTYLLESISTIISRLGVSYIKWDHNRVLVNAGYRGRPTVRQQTLALYQLLGALRLRHPQLDIESCASGGARIDLGIFNYVDRFWTSDCNDALERQMIQRWTMQFIPPELLGFHFGNAPSHQTNRVLSLPFRAITALFGHAGLECDITQFTREDQEAITRWISYYKDKRFLLHSGTMVRMDYPMDEEYIVHGVVDRNRENAIFAVVQLATNAHSQPPNIRFRGLLSHRQYNVQIVSTFGMPNMMQVAAPEWIQRQSIHVIGSWLEHHGLPSPILCPSEALLIEVTMIQ